MNKQYILKLKGSESFLMKIERNEYNDNLKGFCNWEKENAIIFPSEDSAEVMNVVLDNRYEVINITSETDNKYYRNRVISVGDWYVKYNSDGEVELTGELLNSYFFYDKDHCEHIAKSLFDKFPNTKIEVIKLLMNIEIQEKIEIKEC